MASPSKRVQALTTADRRATYQLGEKVGSGGHGVVFQAWHLETGAFVAVKRIALEDIDDEVLASTQTEVELLRKLNHQNIVKYIDTIRTHEHLYIALEYIESGSLVQVRKRFGNFSESLSAIYTSQVLQGLAYLHEQGVLVRRVARVLSSRGPPASCVSISRCLSAAFARSACLVRVSLATLPWFHSPSSCTPPTHHVITAPLPAP